MDPKKNLRIFAKNILYKINKNPVSKALYDYEIQKRSGMPFTSILQLSRHIQMFSPFTCELQPVNDWYGHATILKKFLGLPKNYQFKDRKSTRLNSSHMSISYAAFC